MEDRSQIGEAIMEHKGPVYCVAFSPDGRVLASGGEDKAVRVWDVATRKRIGEPFLGHKGSIDSITFHPDGKSLVSGSRNDTLRQWRWDTRYEEDVGQILDKLPKPPSGRFNTYRGAAFSPDGKVLCFWGEGVKLLDTESWQFLGESLRPAGGKVAFSPDGQLLAVGSYLLDISTERWQMRARQRANRNLTNEERLRYLGRLPPDSD